jgi:LemA protein
MTEILILLSTGAGIWGIVIFNLLVRDNNRVLAAWSDVEVQLKRRHDLIPKLVEAVKAYAGYESALVEQMTRLRTRAEDTDDPEEKERLEGELGGEVHRLVAIAEAYPDLKANTQYLELMEQLTEVENHLQYARRYYNGAVRNLNVRIESFPDLIVAQAFRFRPARLFELESVSEGRPPEHP